MKKQLILLALALTPALSPGETATIQNEVLRATYDDTTGTLAVSRVADGKTFVSEGRLPFAGGAKVSVFAGEGTCLAFRGPAGESASLTLPPGEPFALLHESRTNTTSGEKTFDQLPLINFAPNLGEAASTLVIRGTGGLHAATDYAPPAHPWLSAIWNKITRRHPHVPAGSYEWLAVADPQTRAGIVCGFLSHERAIGVITPSLAAGKLAIDARNEFGRLHLAPGTTAETETFAIGYFDDVRLGLETYAAELAKSYHVHLPPQPAGFTTWYAEKNGGAADEKSLATLSDFIAKNLAPFGMNFVQIDDRWQSGDDLHNGPDKNFTESNPKGPYPSGMKAAADQIRADGLTPGLWFLPFSGAYNDPWFADKQDLFVKTGDGKPYDTKWAGTSLDMTNPAAQKYVQGVVTNIVHNWDFSYLKIDGLFAGLAAQQIYISSDYNGADDFGNAVFADAGKTNVEAFRDGLKLVRATAGPGVFILGCNTAQNMRVFGGSMGLVDAMRIGPDNAKILPGDDGNVGPPRIEISWQTWRDASPVFGSWEYFLNGRLWYDDPDPNYVRASLTLDEARTEASWTAISGELFTSSDWLPDLPPERLDILRRTVAPHGQLARPVDYLENDPPRVWQVIDDQGTVRRDVVALFNFGDAPLTISVPLDRFDLPKADTYAAFDFWANAFLPPVKGAITSTLAPHSCQILALRPMQDHPFVLSTSRHVAQGMIDLTDENWDPATRTLSGKSRVVGGDPYELRMAASDAATWRITAASADGGATISASGDRGLRAVISSPKDAVVAWSLKFGDNL